jgi:hypothetical protein
MHTRYLLIPLAAAFFLSMLYSIHGSEPPAEWKKVDAKQFLFFIPPDMKLVPTHGIDSYVESYRGTNIDLHFDFGPYSDSLNTYKKLPGSVSKTLTIDGKEAQQVSFTNLSGSGYRFDQVIAIHFRDLGDRGNKLTLWATCRTKEHYSAVEQIFSTLRFNKQHDAK